MHDNTFEGNLNIVLIGFTIYYFLERLLRALLQRWNIQLYTSLKKCRKDVVFFTMVMSSLISILLTPYCASALYEGITIATIPQTEA